MLVAYSKHLRQIAVHTSFISRLNTRLVFQIPKFNQLKSQTWYKNRTSLIHLHNMALNRAFYFSYILQKMNDSVVFHIQPKWMCHYFSVAANINANPYGINGSALYFDTNCTYPNWYQTVNFNNTLPLYDPKVSERGGNIIMDADTCGYSSPRASTSLITSTPSSFFSFLSGLVPSCQFIQ